MNVPTLHIVNYFAGIGVFMHSYNHTKTLTRNPIMSYWLSFHAKQKPLSLDGRMDGQGDSYIAYIAGTSTVSTCLFSLKINHKEMYAYFLT